MFVYDLKKDRVYTKYIQKVNVERIKSIIFLANSSYKKRVRVLARRVTLVVATGDYWAGRWSHINIAIV